MGIKMKYSVNVIRTEVITIVVDADNEDMAAEIAESEAYNNDFHNAFDCDYEIGTITRLED